VKPLLKRRSIRCPLTDPEAEASGHERCVNGIDIANAANISKVVLLAQEIGEAIVEGRADDLKVLEEALPVAWKEQWEALRLTSCY
jgi:hypothetical protein